MINENKINEIVQKIVEKVSPEKIILFGSYASGTPKKGSDLDLCIVVDEKTDPEIEWKIKELFWDWLIPLDVIVYSKKEIDEWKEVKMAFPTVIMKKGKVLYEKQY